jgi:cytochrome c oxidase subunit II
MNKYFLLIIVALIVVGGVLFMNQKRPSVIRELLTPTPAMDSFPVKEFSMTAKQFKFDPSVITVKQGDRVRIKITSLDVKHGFALPDFNVDQNLEPGKVVTVDFIADKKGEFPFHCSVICGQGHKEMTGKLVVE